MISIFSFYFDLLQEQHSMFRILSGILTIGNLEFSSDDEGFTRQNFDEEKIKNNLAIIAVCRIKFHQIFERKLFDLEYVWCEFRFNYGMFNNHNNINTK
jgi:hypothetical protein